MDEALVDVDAVRAAREVIASELRHTPTLPTESLSAVCGRRVWLKAEHLQRTGSFKPRGALNRMAHLADDVGEVVAGSAGNHAQGVALAAARSGRTATVYMPETAALPKVAATEDYGAEVIRHGRTVDDSIAAARAHADRTGAAFIPPFDDPDVIAGQGTVGLELVEDAPPLEAVVVPVGGGGLVAGIAVAVRALSPDTRVVGVEARGAASVRASLDAGTPRRLDRVATIADGIAVQAPSPRTLTHVEHLVDDVVTVDDHAIGRAMLLLAERAKAVIEPAGATSLAALLEGRVAGDGDTAVVLSGGNVDPLTYSRLLDHGLSAAGRFRQITVVVADRPGALADVLATAARLGVNVLEVEHHRTGVRIGVDEVEVLLTVETRDRAHGDELVRQLLDAGVTIRA